MCSSDRLCSSWNGSFLSLAPSAASKKNDAGVDLDLRQIDIRGSWYHLISIKPPSKYKNAGGIPTAIHRAFRQNCRTACRLEKRAADTVEDIVDGSGVVDKFRDARSYAQIQVARSHFNLCSPSISSWRRNESMILLTI